MTNLDTAFHKGAWSTMLTESIADGEYGRMLDRDGHLIPPNRNQIHENVSCIAVQNNKTSLFYKDQLGAEYIEWLNGKLQSGFEDAADEILMNVRQNEQNVYESDNWILGEKESTTSERDTGFVSMFMALVKADVGSQLISKEKNMATHVATIIKERDWELKRLAKEHESILEQVVHQLNSGGHDSASDLASKHALRIQEVESNYASQLKSLNATQKRDYRHFIAKLYEDVVLNDSKLDISNDLVSPSDDSSSNNQISPRTQRVPSVSVQYDESFTIYLGAQMKTMHNLRVVAVDTVDLCESYWDESRCLQMCMALYGTQLSALTLLVDPRPNYHISFHSPFASACEKSTELHFPCLAEQIEVVCKQAKKANHWLLEKVAKDPNSERSCYETDVDLSGDCLATGSVYNTRHSNLREAHVAFHLVADSRLKSGDINSRHPCINGLRNIIRMCSKFGITTISIPLLLIDSLTEEHTMQWCMRRAELVFKCVKGFLMEVSSLSGGTQPTFYTLQFLLPKNVSQQVFSDITELLATVFHLVNPVKG